MAAATAEVQSGLEGVVAFATEIAEPDKAGGSLRYRGVDIEDLVGKVPFEKVWGLLVDGSFDPGMPPAVPYPLPMRTGDTRVDVQAALAQLAPSWGFGQLLDISDEEARDKLARASVMALSFVAQSARGDGRMPVPEAEVDRATSIPERFLIRWRGEADPQSRQGDRRLLDLGRGARDERLDLHRARRSPRPAPTSPRRSPAPSARCPVRCTAARPRACSRCSTTSRSAATPRLRKAGARSRRAPDGLRASRVPCRGPARARAPAHRARDRGAAARGCGGARAGRACRAEGAPSRPRARDQRRVLVGGRARLRRSVPPSCSRRCSPARA